MGSTTRLSVESPQDVADAVRARVASGAYRSASEVVADGLAMLAEQDRELDGWESAEMAAGYDAWVANPADVTPLDIAAARLEDESLDRRRPA